MDDLWPMEEELNLKFRKQIFLNEKDCRSRFLYSIMSLFLLKNSAPEKTTNFEFNQFNDFVDYLKQNKFDDKSDAESKWADFEKELKEVRTIVVDNTNSDH